MSFPNPLKSFLLVCLLANGGLATPLSVPALLAGARPVPATIEKVYREAILRDGEVGPIVRELQAVAVNRAAPSGQRATALLVASHLQWRFGRIKEAAQAAEQAVALERSGDTLWLRARLDEASGNLVAARQGYQEALVLLADPEMREEAQLRLVFLETDPRDVRALVELARTRDREFRNRAAVALAILNRPAEAIELYEVHGEGGEAQRHHLRLAQWALAARQAPRAQAEAWQAVLTASLPRDLRYSLGVLVEAHALDESWDTLLARFNERPGLDSEIEAVRVDLLRRLHRYDEAIALATRGRGEGMAPEYQRRLLRMLGEAGRTEEMVAEFRRLIMADPAGRDWPRGLSEYFLEQGRRDDAMQVWRDFIARNEDPGVLLDGGQEMGQLGLAALALEAAARCEALRPDTAQRVAWFRFELHLRIGQMAEAEQILQQLDRQLAPNSPSRTELADAYERIRNPARALAVWEGLASQPAGIGIDEKMRMAWLYDTTGQRDRALGIWRQLWEDEVPEARRRMVEDRLLALASETGRLGDIAIELEQRLAAGQAAAKDSSLLIRIYTAAGDSASAIEVIQEYHGQAAANPESELTSLREQARVYQALSRTAAFIRVTEKLLQLDPANRTDHLQALILAHLERNTRADRQQMEVRLAELRQTSEAADDEFEAGVLVLAGMRAQAIDSYRRALARNPAQSDNYLLLADLLRQDRRAPEAIAMLQYFAEIAPGDDGFMVAIDGILNSRPGEESPVLRWAQRRVLERLTRRDDKFYLYDLSAEVAEEARDMPAYLASLENSLVDAGPRRATVLRELISATEGKARGATTVSAPDLRRNLAFSRRLIALGEEMPPDVYLNIGQTFLRVGDPVEALAAFNLAIDRTDRPSLMEESADRFEAAGFGREAVVLYERALTADPGSVSLLAKLARVRARDGGRAGELYLQALLRLAEQQLVEADSVRQGARRTTGDDENFTYLVRGYFRMLQAGLIYQASPDSPGADLLAPVTAAFQRALQEVVDRAAGRPLVNHPRLNLLSQLLRGCALRMGRYDLADAADLQLLEHFGRDAVLVRSLVQERLAFGLPAAAERLRLAATIPPETQVALATQIASRTSLATITDLAAAARDALAQERFELAVDTALAAGNSALALAVYQEWMSRGSATRGDASTRGGRAAPAVAVRGGAPAAGGRGGTAGPSLTRLVEHARTRLEAPAYLALCRQLAALATADLELGRSLLTSVGAPAFMRSAAGESPLVGVERVLGRPLFTAGQLDTMLAAVPAAQLATLDFDYLLRHLSAPARTDLFLRFLQSLPASAYPAQWVGILRLVLTRPLDPDAFPRMEAAIKTRLQLLSRQPFGLRFLTSGMQDSGSSREAIHAANVDLVQRLDLHCAETYSDLFVVGTLAQVLAGVGVQQSTEEILAAALREHAQDASQPSRGGSNYRLRLFVSRLGPAFFPEGRERLLALIAGKAGPTGLTPELFQVGTAVFAADPAGQRSELIAWVEQVLQREPDHRLALETLHPLLRETGQRKREIDVLERLTALNPANEAVRRRLATLWRELDHPENVRRALGNLEDRPAGERSLVAEGRLFAQAVPQVNRAISRLADPGDPVVARQALRTLLQMLPPSGAPSSETFQMAQRGIPVLPYASFLQLEWADPAARRAELHPLAWLEPDTTAPGTPGVSVRLTDQLAALPGGGMELAAVVRTLDPGATGTDEQFRFYALLADAWTNEGRHGAEFARLAQKVEAGQAGAKELLLWLELAVRQPPALVRSLPPVAEQVLLAAGPLGAYQRILLARLYARAGLSERAIGVYSVAAVAAMSAERAFSSGQRELFTATGLLADAAVNLDPSALAVFAQRLAVITRPWGGEKLEAAHRRFLVELGAQLLRAGVPPGQLPPIAMELDDADATRDDYVRLALIQLRRQQTAGALSGLRRALRPERSQPAIGGGLMDATLDRYTRNLGLPRIGFRGSESLSATEGLSALVGFKELFPTRERREWIQRAARELPGWLDRNEVDRDLGLQVLALLTLRLHQLGLPGAAMSAQVLDQQLARPAPVSVPTAHLAVVTAERVGAPVSLRTLQRLVGERSLPVVSLAGIIRQLGRSGQVSAALDLGEVALDYTRNEALLEELAALARQAGDHDRMNHFAAMRAEAAAARAALALVGSRFSAS